MQGFLAKLGIRTSYVMTNTYIYSVFGQGGANRHRDNPVIAAYRHRWLDLLLIDQRVDAVITLGGLADHAYRLWR